MRLATRIFMARFPSNWRKRLRNPGGGYVLQSLKLLILSGIQTTRSWNGEIIFFKFNSIPQQAYHAATVIRQMQRLALSSNSSGSSSRMNQANASNVILVEGDSTGQLLPPGKTADKKWKFNPCVYIRKYEIAPFILSSTKTKT